MIDNRLNTFDSRTFYLHSQFLLDAVETFAKKHGCLEHVTNEYRRRIAIDDRATELYRYTTDNTKSLFAAHGELTSNMINIEKYNPITDRWELYRNIKTRDFDHRINIGLVYAEDNIFLIGRVHGQSSVSTASYFISSIDCLYELFIWQNN